MKELNDEDDILEENLDDWALNEMAFKHNVRKADLKHALLGEAISLDQAARELEAEEFTEDKKNQITAVLDRSLKRAKSLAKRGAKSDFPNVLVIGQAGSGKTEIIRQWAKDNGINLVQKNLGTMGAGDFGGILTKDVDSPKYATRIGTNEMIKALEKPNSVLFLDEYNRSKTEVRGAVLTLVQNHRVWDPNEPDGERFLDNFLFTIAAINPSGSTYKGAKEMDPAELSRFYSLSVHMDPLEHLKHLRAKYNREINNGDDEEEILENRRRLNLAETLLNSPDFKYDSIIDEEEGMDTPGYKPLNYRSLTMALDFSDGTKEDFLDIWNHYCNPKKKFIVETILKDYEDIDDKANDALARGTSSNVFKKKLSNMDAIFAQHPDLRK